MAFEDEITLGEALRGMQAQSRVGSFSEIGAAAPRRLSGALGQLANQHFARHAPAQKTMRSSYKDSTQIGVSMTGTFTLNSWSGSVLPQISGLTRVYKSFKPEKIILTELVTVVWANASMTSKTKSKNIDHSADLILVSAFAGADNCFPNAPNEANGIAGPALANVAYGNGISWPTINGGIDLTIAVSIEPSVISAIDAPSGYTDDDIVSIVVKSRLTVMGESLR